MTSARSDRIVAMIIYPIISINLTENMGVHSGLEFSSAVLALLQLTVYVAVEHRDPLTHIAMKFNIWEYQGVVSVTNDPRRTWTALVFVVLLY
jgi:hypothetical protein